MKAKEYLRKLKELVELYGNLELVYSHDDEGNCYQKVVYNPSVGIFEGDFYGEFYHPDDLGENKEPNCICIN